MLWTDRRTETDNTTALVATRFKYDPTSKGRYTTTNARFSLHVNASQTLFLIHTQHVSVVRGRCRSHSTLTHFIESTQSSLTFVNTKCPKLSLPVTVTQLSQ